MANLRKTARDAAKRHGLDPDIFERQIQQESGFNPNARSPVGAAGIAQIMPATARGWGVNPMDPHAALDAAAKNMRGYVEKYGGYENALRAYNAGPGAIERSKTFAETNNYVSRILGGKTPKPLGKTTGGSSSSSTTTTTTTPGVNNRAARAQLVLSFLGQKGGDVLDFATQARALRDVAPTSNTTRTGSTSSTPAAPSSGGGRGAFKIAGPNPKRLQPQLTNFAAKVADAYGGTLQGLDGSTHSKFTVNGNVSQHYTGNATDIFSINGKPATGQRLIDAGRAALVAAGMPRSKAMKMPGGLYNVGNHQIIFGVSGAQNGGDHTDHLHISAR